MDVQNSRNVCSYHNTLRTRSLWYGAPEHLGLKPVNSNIPDVERTAAVHTCDQLNVLART